jgi:hypothetical protein
MKMSGVLKAAITAEEPSPSYSSSTKAILLSMCVQSFIYLYSHVPLCPFLASSPRTNNVVRRHALLAMRAKSEGANEVEPHACGLGQHATDVHHDAHLVNGPQKQVRARSEAIALEKLCQRMNTGIEPYIGLH